MRVLVHLFHVVAPVTLILITGVMLTAPVFAQFDQAQSDRAQSDQDAAARVLGPKWQQLSRRAGMIFAGTVLASPSQPLRSDRGVPSVEISLRIERAIAGVEPGQILTIREWTGALSSHPAMRPGEHLLLFLYPPSHLGLTSPVGGAQGQIRLDALGSAVIDQGSRSRSAAQTSLSVSPTATRDTSSRPINLTQLERAIRAARGE